MIWSLAKNTEWAPLLDLLSPTFFDVVPARMLFAEARGLTSRYLSRSSYDEACASRASALAGARLPFEIVRSASDEAAATVPDVARSNDILDLYFHQVLGDGPVLLDMRRRAFTRRHDRWLWKPEPAIAVWGTTSAKA